MGGRYDRQSPIVRLLDIARIQGSYRIVRLHDHAVGADDTIEVCPIEFTQRIADARPIDAESVESNRNSTSPSS